jgi:hypothetical protein
MLGKTRKRKNKPARGFVLATHDEKSYHAIWGIISLANSFISYYE